MGKADTRPMLASARRALRNFMLAGWRSYYEDDETCG